MIQFNPCSCSMSLVQHAPCHGVLASPPSRRPHPWATMVPKERQLPARKPGMFWWVWWRFTTFNMFNWSKNVLKRYLWDYLEWWKQLHSQNYATHVLLCASLEARISPFLTVNAKSQVISQIEDINFQTETKQYSVNKNKLLQNQVLLYVHI